MNTDIAKNLRKKTVHVGSKTKCKTCNNGKNKCTCGKKAVTSIKKPTTSNRRPFKIKPRNY